MEKILVISKRHGLLPFANRLSKLDGVDIEVLISKTSYEPVWEGKFGKILRGRDKARENLQPVVDAAEAGEILVLTDDPFWSREFAAARHVAGALPLDDLGRQDSRMVIGSWVGPDREARLRHVLFLDRGAWPGGQGFQGVPVGAVLVRPMQWLGAFEDALRSTISELPEGWVGLVGVFALVDDSGRLRTIGRWGGWPFLHAHAFWSEIEASEMLQILLGDPGKEEILPGPTFTTLVPVSIPPWPIRCNFPSGNVNIEVSPPQVARQVFFHDIRVVEKQLQSAGTDGLIGVARGSSNVLGISRQRALQAAQAIQVGPERQIRPDIGAHVEILLGVLELAGMPVL